MEEVKGININTQIQGIYLINFSVVESADELRKSLDRKKFAFEHTLKVNILSEKKCVQINGVTKIFSDITKATYLGEIEVSGLFEILNFEEIFQRHNGIPQQIIALFMSVLLSTSRGMLIVKSEGTILTGAIIPIVNANDFFQKNQKK